MLKWFPLLVAAAVLLVAVPGAAVAGEICFGPGGLDVIFRLDATVSFTSAGAVFSLVGTLRSNSGGPVALDPTTGTAILEDPTHLRINLTQAALTGNTIYSARLTSVPGFAGGFFWVGTATVNRLPQGTTLFPQTTTRLDIVDCATGEIRQF